MKRGLRMVIDKRDAVRMKTLVREGKRITRIIEEDFPRYDYWDVYHEVYGAGDQSAQGVKWMITNRLKRLQSANQAESQEIIDEISDLVWYLYNNYRLSQRKLDGIRKALGD